MSLRSSPALVSGGDGKAHTAFRPLLLNSLQAHSIFFLIAIVYFLAVGWHYDFSVVDRAFDVVLCIVGLSVTSLLLGGIYRFYVYVSDTRPHHPTAQLFRDLRSLARDKARLSLIVPSVLSISIFVETYVKAKSQIVPNATFYWDETFTQWDLLLHLGSLPWQWFQPVLGHPVLSFMINVNYNCWVLVAWAGWMAFAYSERHRAVRTRFLLSFMLIWSLGGTVAATALASLGPCYYDEMGWLPNPYGPLFTYLRHADAVLPLWSLDVQDRLWQGNLGSGVPLGISAMPSMHNASALLIVLASRTFARPVRWALAIHAVLVFVGSVHLGWHYAVDAYAAWALTILLWHAARPLAEWWDGRAPSVRFWKLLEASRSYPGQ